MQFNPGSGGTLKSETFESALVEMLVAMKVAENFAYDSGSITEPKIHLSFDAYSRVVSFSGDIAFEFRLDPDTRSVVFDCHEYLP